MSKMIKTSVNTKIARARTRKAQYKVTKAKLAYKNEKNSYQDSFIEDIKAFGRVCLKRIKQLIIILIVIYVASVIWKGRYNYFVTTYTVKSHIYQANPEEASTEAPDPCGLKDVICEGEKVAKLQEVPQGKEGIVSMISEEFGDDAKVAIAVARAESGLNPETKGDTHIEFERDGKIMGHSCGLFQIRVLPGRPDCETLKDPKFNIEYAKKLFDRSGFQPWSAYKNGSYLKFM